MKNKLIYLFEFLKQFNCDEFLTSYYMYEEDYDIGGIESLYCADNNKLITPPKTLYDILLSVLNSTKEDIENEVDKSDDVYDIEHLTGYKEVNVRIIPYEKKIIFDECLVEFIGEEYDGIELNLEDEDDIDDPNNNFNLIKVFLEENNTNRIVIDYSGGGDSGYIQDNGKDENFRDVKLSTTIEDICYSLLETFGGWEIDEGSRGEIYLSKDNITINHVWYRTARERVKINYEISLDKF